MTVYTYSRVSTESQNVQQQVQVLEKYNPDYSISEKFTGTTLDRPKFDKLVKITLKPGDSLIVQDVSRLGRKASAVFALAEDLQDRNIKLIVDNLGGLDVTSSAGKLIFTILSGIAAASRETMLERQKIGINRAKAEGRYKGRKALDPVVVKTAKDLVASGMKKKDVASQLKIGESTLYKYLAMK